MSRNIEPGDWSIEQVTQPAGPAMTVAAAKGHLRIPDEITEHDVLIAGIVASAQSYLEEAYNTRAATQQIDYVLECFPDADRIRLPIWPVQSLDLFTYQDTGFNQLALAIGRVAGTQLIPRLERRPAELVLGYGLSWPGVVLAPGGSIRARLTVGYPYTGSPAVLQLPSLFTRAMLLLIDHWYNNTSATTLGTLSKSDPLHLAVKECMAPISVWVA